MPTYAGIGSRETPPDVLEVMEALGATYAEAGWTLRSGGAKGADRAFEAGCDHAGGKKEIFRGEDATREAFEFSAAFHPNWAACRPYARELHARNAMIIMGERLNNRVAFVVCWTKDGKGGGGTGQGIRIAKAHDIIVYDLGDPTITYGQTNLEFAKVLAHVA